MDSREQARILFEQGERLVDIADKLNINYNTVKQWRNRGQWKKPKKTKKKVTQKVTQKSNCTKVTKVKEIVLKENIRLTEKQAFFCLYYIKSFNATQSYLKAYQCSYNTAMVEGSRLLLNPKIRDEINRLKEIKRQTIMITEDDIIERYMRIAFLDITDFTEFGQEEVPIITKEGPVFLPDSDTGELKPLMQTINVLKFKSSDMVDGGLISEIKQGRQGVSLKLEDKQKALKWLADFFGMNPEHKHRIEYDAKKLQLEQERLQHTKEMDKLKVF